MQFAVVLCLALGGTVPAPAAGAPSKTTYNDHVLPIIEANCAKCHNADKRKGDLDLTSYSSLLKGGGSGAVVVSGNPDASKLWKAITHAEDPTMPPNKPPLPEKELAVFRQWITDGLLETAGGKAIAAAKPALDLSLKMPANSRPEGPPPMPGELPIDPVVHTARGNPINSLAASPWAPLVAIAGQKQILLYNTGDFNLLGILPFPDGQPCDLKFARSGKLLLAGGGRGAKSGFVLLFDIETGRRIASLAHEYDSVLAADVSPDQTQVALGGPDRLIKIYATANGELLHKIKKHTDWVTALAYSPNGAILASADRNGGVALWDPENGQELLTTAGHKGSVTALSWRVDSKLLASASEDGTVKLWESTEGKQFKTWNAHAGGALDVACAQDGRLVSCGRDGSLTVWSPDGSKLKSCSVSPEPVVHCALSDDGAQLIAGDFEGRVTVWDAKTGQRVGELDANPLPVAEKLTHTRKLLEEAQARGDQPSPALSAAEKEARTLEHELADTQTAADKAKDDFTAKARVVAQLKETAAAPNPPADIQDQLAKARAVREKARAVNTAAIAALAAKQRHVEENRSRTQDLRRTADPAAEIARLQADVQRLTLARQRGDLWQAREEFNEARSQLEASKAVVETKTAACVQLKEQLAQAKGSAEKSRLKAALKTAETERRSADAALQQATKNLAAAQTRLDRATADYEQLRTATAAAASHPSKL